MQGASSFPWTTNSKKLSKDIPDTAIEGAGYVKDCDISQCAGADVNYYFQATLKEIPIQGSRKIETTPPGTYPNLFKPHTISDRDVVFLTRHFEAMPDAPNSPFAPDSFGGNGTGGILGPALVMLPGQSVNIFVKNLIKPGYQKDPAEGIVPTDQSYAEKVNNVVQTGFRMAISDIGSGNEEVVFPDGKVIMTAAQMDVPLAENQPGWDTNHSFNEVNIHLHGMEVPPHLFHPMGTSDPEADWITIKPTAESDQQCYCYKFKVGPTQSKGLFAYHTHRHGTTSMTTWSGMFGAIVTDNFALPSQAPSAPDVTTKEPATNPATSLMYNLVQMTEQYNIPFDDSDVFPFIIYNSMWKFRGHEYDDSNPTNKQEFPAVNSPQATKVEVNGFLQNEIPTTQVNPFLVNQEYQPTLTATAGHLSMFRILCISTQYLCGFQITEDSTGDNLAYYVISSDGITFSSPEYFSTGKISIKRSTVEAAANMFTFGHPLEKDIVEALEGLEPQDNAYLSLGGGMRQDVVLQFEVAGNYTISQAGYPGFNPYQKLASVVVQASSSCGQDSRSKCKTTKLNRFVFTAARDVQKVMQRPTGRHLGMDFEQQLDRGTIPFVQWGLADAQGTAFKPYNHLQTDMVTAGGTCAEWTIRSKDVIFHPFHIHVNPFVVTDVQMDPEQHSVIASTASVLQRLLTATAFFNPALVNHFRDTVMVPPMGSVTLKQCFDAGPAEDKFGTQTTTFAGKFVFHCHFLTHEDTGLIHNVMLTRGNFTPQAESAASSSLQSAPVGRHSFQAPGIPEGSDGAALLQVPRRGEL